MTKTVRYFVAGIILPLTLLTLAPLARGQIFVSMPGGGAILQFDPNGGPPTTFASGLPSGLANPQGLAFDSAGFLYAVNGGNNEIVKFPAIPTAGSSQAAGVFVPASGSGLFSSFDLIFNGGFFYAASGGPDTIEKFDNSGVRVTPTFASTGVNANPYGLTFDSTGNLYVANRGAQNILMFPPGSSTPSVFASGLSNLRDLAWRAGALYVAGGGTAILEFTATGSSPGTPVLSPTFVGVNDPRGLAFDCDGNLYVTDHNGFNGTLTKFNSMGDNLWTESTGQNTPGFVAIQCGPISTDVTSCLPMINSSFEADAFTTLPGYVFENAQITGWSSSVGRSGINPVAGSNPFADNGTAPDGNQVAFLQEDGELSQVVGGFTVGAQYYVQYYENARDCCDAVPFLEVTIGGDTIVAAHAVPPVGGSNPYHHVTSSTFTATAASLELAFIKSNPQGGDTTALIDNVCITPLPCGLSGVLSADGTTITYNFSGALANPFGTLAVGTPFTGSFSYAVPQPDLDPTNPNRGDYLYQSISLTFGSTTVTDTGTGVINTYDSATYPTDLFHIYTFNVTGSLGGLTLAPGAGIQLSLQDLTGTAWSSTTLPGPGLTMANLTAGAATHIELRHSGLTPDSFVMARGPLECVTLPVDDNANCETGPNLVENGSFEVTSPVVAANAFNNSLDPAIGVSGWTTTSGNFLEVWSNNVGFPASDGVNQLEINAQSHDQTVSQVITNLSTECETTFSFDYTGRFGDAGGTPNNDFIVTLSGGHILSAPLNPAAHAAGGWTKFSVTFVPTSPVITIEFKGQPHFSDGTIFTQGGAHVDNVSLTQCCETEPGRPVIQMLTRTQAVQEGDSATFSVSVAGAPPFSYQWFKDSILIPGATDTSLRIPSVSLADAGYYSLMASNAAGVTTSRPVLLRPIPKMSSAAESTALDFGDLPANHAACWRYFKYSLDGLCILLSDDVKSVSSVPVQYPTFLEDNGARHYLYRNLMWLGSDATPTSNGTPGSNARRDPWIIYSGDQPFSSASLVKEENGIHRVPDFDLVSNNTSPMTTEATISTTVMQNNNRFGFGGGGIQGREMYFTVEAYNRSINPNSDSYCEPFYLNVWIDYGDDSGVDGPPDGKFQNNAFNSEYVMKDEPLWGADNLSLMTDLIPYPYNTEPESSRQALREYYSCQGSALLPSIGMQPYAYQGLQLFHFTIPAMPDLAACGKKAFARFRITKQKMNLYGLDPDPSVPTNPYNLINSLVLPDPSVGLVDDGGEVEDYPFFIRKTANRIFPGMCLQLITQVSQISIAPLLSSAVGCIVDGVVADPNPVPAPIFLGLSSDLDVYSGCEIASYGAPGGPYPLDDGERFHFVAELSNSGGIDLTDVVVVYTIPANAVFYTAAIDNGAWIRQGNTVTFTLPKLAADEQALIGLNVLPQSSGMLNHEFKFSSKEIPAISVVQAATFVEVGPGITISSQPQGLTAAVGDNVTFSVMATGAPPLSYQWRFNNANIPGATDATYTILNAREDNAGIYEVVVSNARGSLTSEQARLTMIPNGVPQVAASYSGACCWEFLVWQNFGAPAYSFVTAYVPVGVGVSSVSGPGISTWDPVTRLIRWDIPGGLLANHGSEETVQACFTGLGAGGVTLIFQGNDPFPSQYPQNVVIGASDECQGTVFANKDFQNNTGQAVDGMEWLVQGTYSSVVSHYDGPYPGQPNSTFTSFTIVPLGANTLFRWSGGASIPNGGLAHVGFTVAGTTLTTLGASWTIGGVEAGCVHQISVGEGFSHVSGEVVFWNTATTCESQVLYVGNITLEWFSTEVPLADLSVNGVRRPLRVDDISSPPIAISPGGSVSVKVPFPPIGALFAMIRYTVSDSPTLAGPGNTIDYQEVQLQSLTEGPAITGQPQSQTATIGSDVSFGVTATGTPPLSYQWRFNANPIFGATNIVLTIVNAREDNAGIYDVVVSNASGSVTSAPAWLMMDSLSTGTCDPGKVIWVDIFNGIDTADLDGANHLVPWNVFNGFANTGLDVAINPASGKIYWGDNSTMTGKVMEGNMDGTGTPVVVTTTFSGEGVHYIAVDPNPGAEKVYWADFAGRIYRSNIGLGAMPTLIVNHGFLLRGIALDLRPGSPNLYYYNGVSIYRANLDGTSPVQLPNAIGDGGAPGAPGQFALDTCNDKIYVVGKTDPHPGVPVPYIRSANLSDGSGLTTILSGSALVGNEPGDIALDLHTRTMYWTSENNSGLGGQVKSANMDTGSGLTILPVTGGSIFSGIALCLADNSCPTSPTAFANKDFQNNTGQTVDGIEWLVQGQYSSVISHYDGPYPGEPNSIFSSFAIVPAGANTLLRWSGGASIPNGGKAHVGFTVAGASLTTLGASWTIGGVYAGCVHQVSVGEGFSHATGEVVFLNTATTCESQVLYAGNITLEWFSTMVPLAELSVNGVRRPLRADDISSPPIAISPGGSASVKVPLPPIGARFAMIRYTVSDSPTLAGPGNTIDYQEVQLQSLTEGPAITGQPQSQTATIGSDVSFGVTATGTPPLSYQWRFNANPIFGATNIVLTIVNAREDNAGIYDVVVSDANSSVTSAQARLTMKDNFTMGQNSDGTLSVSWPPDEGWILQEAINLLGPWSNSALQSSPVKVTPSGKNRFYRLVKP